ncbi:MAG: GNAT family N-acetyltransferase [Phycisphaerales bacterium]|jgi:ribosomal protein S18 acetylase RimI-like enzyme|nr:GNAT family N-acetyltransferase [Phycisphaerales bacterium]
MSSITLVSPDRYEEALRCVLGRRRAVAMTPLIDRLTTAGRLRDGSLMAAETSDGRFVAASLMVQGAGRTVSVMLSTPHGSGGAARCEAVLNSAVDSLAGWPVDLAQALLSPSDTAVLGVFEACEFFRLAELHTMTMAVRSRRGDVELPEGLALRDASDAELPGILDQTYVDTQDCPQLHGLRHTVDIVAGHRAGGQVVSALWQTIVRDGQPVGCVLMTCDRDAVADLAYIGLMPSSRGRGIAGAVLRVMLKRLLSCDIRTIRLAVDATNAPATRLYRQLGFKKTQIQIAVIRSTRDLQVGAAHQQDVHKKSTS